MPTCCVEPWKKGEAIMERDWIAGQQIRQFVFSFIQASWILPAKIWNCPAEGVL
jgi:hypothetical protein